MSRAIHEPLRQLYADLDEEIAKASPRCDSSGRCCRFVDYGHTLFVSEWEAEYLLETELPPRAELHKNGCPYQIDGLCTARERRPLGCRLYFCDPGFAERLPVLAEQYIRQLKRLHQTEGRPWDYRPFHDHLQRLTGLPVRTEARSTNPGGGLVEIT